MTSEQLEDLTRDPLKFFKRFSTWCHMQAKQAAAARDHEIPAPRNVWADTADLMDLALLFWQQNKLPADTRRHDMATLLDQIRQTVESYLPPNLADCPRYLWPVGGGVSDSEQATSRAAAEGGEGSEIVLRLPS